MNKKFLFFITLIAFLIRFINFRYPSLLWDEAAIGYNAYSILTTGKDEYGQILPLIFKSFGDYKPGFYIYTAIPFVAVFGLNELSVRFPSILAGSLLPLLFYLLILKIYPGKFKLAQIASILLTFNPWNIHFSRGAWETNLLLFELVFACLLFLNKRYLLSGLLFSLGLYTYQSAKIIVPLLSILLIFQTKKFPKIFFITLFLLATPILFGLIFGPDSNRLKVMSLYSYLRPENEKFQIVAESNLLDYQLFYSQPLFFLRNVATRYFNYFSARFLIFEGDWQTARHSAPYIGVVLYPTLFFFVIGFFLSLRNWRRHRFFLFWLLLSPFPAALSLDIIQPVRNLSLSIPILFFAALGLNQIKLLYLKVFIIVVYLSSFFYYLELYSNHLTKIKPNQWLVGYKEAIEYVIKNGQNRRISITPFYGQPYIFYLFYSKYPPSCYQLQADLNLNGVDTGTINQIDDVSFLPPDIKVLQSSSNSVLAVISYDEIIRQGQNPNDFLKLSPLFYVYQN